MQRVLLFCLLFTALAAPARSAQTPLSTLTAVQTAIDTNDQALLERHIDVAGIIGRGVDAFADELAASPSDEPNPVLDMLSGGLSDSDGQSGVSPSMKQLLADATYMFVMRGVAAGDFSGHPSARQDLPEGGILSALFADASRARKELRHAQLLSTSGDRATASASVYDYGSERSYPVRVRLHRQSDGHWKVTDVDNMRDLIHRILQENR